MTVYAKTGHMLEIFFELSIDAGRYTHFGKFEVECSYTFRVFLRGFADRQFAENAN